MFPNYGLKRRENFETSCYFRYFSSNYLINGIPDDTEGVKYRSSPRGWMSQELFVNYFASPSIIELLNGNRTRGFWIDSIRAHIYTTELEMGLKTCRTKLKIFEPNCTTTAQPLDQLLPRCFKAQWRKKWYANRNCLVNQEQCSSRGWVRNSGKYFYWKWVKKVLAKRSLIISSLTPGASDVQAKRNHWKKVVNFQDQNLHTRKEVNRIWILYFLINCKQSRNLLYY